MDQYKLSKDSSLKHLKVGDHILTQTYPLVKDPKLLVVVVENLHKACEGALSAILEFERKYKKIPPYHESFSDKLRVFQIRNKRRYGFDERYVPLMRSLYQLVQDRISAPVEFTRRNKFVMADDDYRLSELTPEKLREHLNLAKLFIHDMEDWVERHERTL